jgi:hypothetical protein
MMQLTTPYLVFFHIVLAKKSHYFPCMRFPRPLRMILAVMVSDVWYSFPFPITWGEADAPKMSDWSSYIFMTP